MGSIREDEILGEISYFLSGTLRSFFRWFLRTIRMDSTRFLRHRVMQKTIQVHMSRPSEEEGVRKSHTRRKVNLLTVNTSSGP